MNHPIFICCPARKEVLIEAPSSQSRPCSFCDEPVLVSPNMLAVEKRESEVIFLCRSNPCLDKAKAKAHALGRPIKAQFGRDFYRAQYDEYPPA